jgi:type IV pilus assembly protein PilV
VTGWDAAAAPTPDCKASACTAAQLAARDIWEWQDEVGKRLPLGKATVFMSSDEDADNKRQLGVMVGWRSNERSLDDAYTSPLVKLAPTGTGNTTCPTGLICHLVYVQP